MSRLLRKGMSGPDVRKLSEDLVDLGYRPPFTFKQIAATDQGSLFDDELERAVREFQSENFDTNGSKLAVDGLVGPATQRSIAHASNLPVKGFYFNRALSKRQISCYMSIPVKEPESYNRANQTFKFNEILPIATRGLYMLILDEAPPETPDRNYLRKFTGSAVLVRAFGNGDFEVIGSPFSVSAHPGQATTTSSGTPDVDGDGQRDIAWIMTDTAYLFRGKRSGSNRRFNTVTYESPVHRDFTNKGTLDRVERTMIYPATAIQYHDDGGAGRPISVGCITSPIREYNKVAEWIEAQPESNFRIILKYF